MNVHPSHRSPAVPGPALLELVRQAPPRRPGRRRSRRIDSLPVRRLLFRYGCLERLSPDRMTRRHRLLALLGDLARRAGVARAAAGRVLTTFARRGPCRRVPACGTCPLAGECRFPRRRPTLADLPLEDRPREKLLRWGSERLTDGELLAILLQSGTPDASAVDLAQTLLRRFGGLLSLTRAPAPELQAISGVGPAKVTMVLAAAEMGRRLGAGRLQVGEPFRSPEAVFQHYQARLGDLRQEQFYCLLLDGRNRVLREVLVSTGSLTASLVHPREVFRPAIREAAAAVLFIHNHPSGDPSPSQEDLVLTRRLEEVGLLVGIPVLDHVIVGRERYISFRDQGGLGEGADP